MSAWIVEPETIDKAVAGILIARALRAANGPPRPAEAGDLGARLMRMNAAAVTARNGGDGEGGEAAARFDRLADRYVAAPHMWMRRSGCTEERWNPVHGDPRGRKALCHIVRSMECLHHQCGDGGVPETWPEYTLLAAAIETIKGWIVASLYDYQNAPWR
jgi:hypothetical protein